jgi:hypothetical protein
MLLLLPTNPHVIHVCSFLLLSCCFLYKLQHVPQLPPGMPSQCAPQQELLLMPYGALS